MLQLRTTESLESKERIASRLGGVIHQVGGGSATSRADGRWNFEPTSNRLLWKMEEEESLSKAEVVPNFVVASVLSQDSLLPQGSR